MQLKRNLQSLVAEHNIDMSKLQSTTKEHADTTNAFALMHKEIKQLRIEKYVCAYMNIKIKNPYTHVSGTNLLTVLI